MTRRFVRSLGVCIAVGLAAGRKAPASSIEPIDINRATVEDLASIHGLQFIWAKRIVLYRPYRTKTDLVEQGIVTETVYSRIKSEIIAHRMGDITKREQGNRWELPYDDCSQPWEGTSR